MINFRSSERLHPGWFPHVNALSYCWGGVACKLNGQYILLFRSHLRNGRSIIGIARSDDGYEFQSDPEPFMVPAG
ncbi:MAG TPA: hypothetical protein VGC50_08135, partial [Gammaproteobacteria bacterium]